MHFQKAYVSDGYLTWRNKAETQTGEADHRLEKDVHPTSAKLFHGPPRNDAGRKLNKAQKEEVDELVPAHVGHVDAQAIVRRTVGYPLNAKTKTNIRQVIIRICIAEQRADYFFAGSLTFCSAASLGIFIENLSLIYS